MIKPSATELATRAACHKSVRQYHSGSDIARGGCILPSRHSIREGAGMQQGAFANLEARTLPRWRPLRQPDNVPGESRETGGESSIRERRVAARVGRHPIRLLRRVRGQRVLVL